MEAARTNGGGPYQWGRPLPMEAARTNGGGQYQRRRPVPMEATRTNEGDLACVYPSILATINNYVCSITKADGLVLVYN
jgi:hypothetical protein